MGNFLALASLTATIGYMLEEVNKDVPGIKITTRPLDALETQNPVNGLNIFLYLVKPSSSLGVIDVMANDSSGNPTANPLLLLDLHYMITATAAENDDLVAQQILASAMRILNEHPIISRETIRKAIRNKEGLAASDLADQVEDVKLNLDSLTAEDLTKIWSRFPSANFRPSVAYTATVVLLESKLVEPPGPMRSLALGGISQLKSPTIDRIEPRFLEYAPNAEIMIVGDNLLAGNVSVEFNESIIVNPRKAEDVSEKRIIVPIPTQLEPGIIRVKVIHRLSSQEDYDIGNRAKIEQDSNMDRNRASLSSNISPFVLAPRIVSPRASKVKRGSDLVIDFEPAVSRDKVISVLLGDRAFHATEVKSTDTQPETRIKRAKVKVPEDLVVGAHLLRLSINGADSRLGTDDNPRSPNFRKSIEPFIEVIQ